MRFLQILTGLLCCWFAGPLSAQSLISVHFDSDRATLRAEDRALITETIHSLKGQPGDWRVRIIGHTDSQGSDAYNKALSASRSRAVAGFLVEIGWDEAAVVLEAYGENKPEATNASEAGRQQNRRVELVFETGGQVVDWKKNNRVPEARLRFEAEKGFRFESPVSGTRVRIPAGQLVNARGEAVSGPVEVSFREYRSIPDFLAAGMPMHYHDGRGDFFFNSAGMFEIRVSQAGEELFMAPGSTYEVDFMQTAGLADASLFRYDDRTGNWEYSASAAFAGQAQGGQPMVVGEDDVVRNNSRAWMAYEGCFPQGLAYVARSQHTDWLMDAIRTGQELSRGETAIPAWLLKNLGKSESFFLRSLSKSSLQVVMHQDIEERFFVDDPLGRFVELSAFSDCHFIRISDSSDIRKERFGQDGAPSVGEIFRDSERKWRSVWVRQELGSNCVIALADDEEEIRIHARLCRSNEIGAGTPFDPDAVFARYRDMRSIREKEMIEPIRRWIHFFQVSPMLQKPEEWCLDHSAWYDYFMGRKAEMRERYDSLAATGLLQDETAVKKFFSDWLEKMESARQARTRRLRPAMEAEGELQKALQLESFGLYNCDQIFRLNQQPEFVEARYLTEDGQRIPPASLRVLEREGRMFFTGVRPSRMYKMPGRKMDIILTGEDGKTYYLSADKYARLDFGESTEYTFTLTDVSDRVKTPKAWSDLLGI